MKTRRSRTFGLQSKKMCYERRFLMSCKVLLTEEIDATGKSYLLERGYEIKMGTGITEDCVKRDIADCDAVLTRNARITEAVMRAAPKLRVISMHGVGVDLIDVEAATRLGIQVTNAAGSNRVAVAEYTIGLIISLARNMLLYDRELRGGNWQIRSMLGMNLEGKVLGIVGMGSIGTLVAQKAALGLGMKVIGFRRHPEAQPSYAEVTADLERVLGSADFVSLHVPSTPETRRMIGERELAAMKQGSFLINTARGDIVDTGALVDALKRKHLSGAAVDVFEGEIPSPDHPLLHMPNVIVSPHAAAFSRETIARMSLLAAAGVDEVLSGKKPTSPVNRVEGFSRAG